MLYLHSSELRQRFELLLSPAPPLLLPALMEQRGLGVVVLPKASDPGPTCRRLGVSLTATIFDGRPAHQSPHYNPITRRVVLPEDCLALPSPWEGNAVLHELGHAVDALLWGSQPLVSDYLLAKKLLPKKPLNDYCQEQQTYYEQHNIPGVAAEQFAYCFSAYFCEPFGGRTQVPNITSLSPGLISFLRKTLVLPFLP